MNSDARSINRPGTNWLHRWWPALLWAIIISIFSTRFFGSDETSRVIIPILHWFFPSASADMLGYLHHLVRKTAHLVEYFIFSLLILRAIRGERRGIHLRWALLTILLVGVYASLDEIHQIFVPGRGPAVHDVLLDVTGGSIAQVLAALLALWQDGRERRAGQNPERPA